MCKRRIYKRNIEYHSIYPKSKTESFIILFRNEHIDDKNIKRSIDKMISTIKIVITHGGATRRRWRGIDFWGTDNDLFLNLGGNCVGVALKLLSNCMFYALWIDIFFSSLWIERLPIILLEYLWITSYSFLYFDGGLKYLGFLK